MAEYIELATALKAVNEFYHDPKVDIALKNIPAVDVVEVVRCKECIFASSDGTICRCGVGAETQPNGYCHKGERKEENEQS
jgi:hypothetical protein